MILISKHILYENLNKIHVISNDIVIPCFNFLVWQLHKGFFFDSTIELLVVLCKSHYTHEINELCTLMKISNFQYEWAFLNVMSALKKWDELERFFIKPVS